MASLLQLGMGWFTEEAGGLNRMYAGLYGALLDDGVAVRGVIAGDPAVAGATPPGLRFAAPRDALTLRRIVGFRRAVAAILGELAVDTVAAHFAPYALPVLDLIRDRRFVVHFHGPWAQESLAEHEAGAGVRIKRAVEQAVYSRADRFIVLSRAFGELLARQYDAPMERIRVVPGGVDVGRFDVGASRAEARERLGLPAARRLVGVVRRLVHRMGVENLVDALGAVRQRVPEVLLVIAGTGPLGDALCRRAAERGVADHVRFLGFVADRDLPLLYRACELTIVPSLALEGFGLTTIESLAAGTPVLVTPVGGLPETVVELDPRLVLAGSNPGALAAGLSAALQGEMVLPTRDACVAYARARFDWPIIARRTLAAYE